MINNPCHVVITRPLSQSDELSNLLHANGFIPHFFPCISIQKATLDSNSQQKLYLLLNGHYQWLVFSSQNAAIFLADHLQTQKIPSSLRIAAIGDKTAAAIKDKLGRTPDFLAPKATAHDLGLALLPHVFGPLLIAQGNLAREELKKILTFNQCVFDTLTVYKTLPVQKQDFHILRKLDAKQTIITFFSPSAVDNFFDAIKNTSIPRSQLDAWRFACIGKSTAQAVTKHGFMPTVGTHAHSAAAFVNALMELQA